MTIEPQPPEGPASEASAPPSPIEAIVADVAADPPRLADPEVATRAALLSELDAARLIARLRTIPRILAENVKRFAAKVSTLRKEAEKREAAKGAAARRVEHVPSWRDELTPTERGETAATFSNLCLLLTHLYTDRLSFDSMAQRPCFDGAPLTDRIVSEVRRRLGALEAVNFGKEDIGDAIGLVGGEMSDVHPVREYLRACREKWDGVKRLGRAASKLLGVPATDKLSCAMVRHTIVAGAARGLYPGCKVDTILILLGHQGARKSTFFRTLGGMWFGDSKVDITDRKGQMVMASRWIYEWPEVDRVFAKHSDSDIKAFVSQQDDHFIPMYGRSVLTNLRSWLAVGTTNRPKFLTDVTGDRRVWVVDLRFHGPKWKIDAKKVAEVRDNLFGEAVEEIDSFYRLQAEGVADNDNPHRWWLDDAEEAERGERAKDFHVENTWVETVGKWLAGEPVKCAACKGSGEGFGMTAGTPNVCSPCGGSGGVTRGPLPQVETGREYVTPALVLSEALGIPPERHASQGTKIADTLAELGWIGGKRIRAGVGSKRQVTPYYSPEPNPDADEKESQAAGGGRVLA